MSTLLYVQANPRPAAESKSLTMAREFMKVYQETHPEDKIVSVDCYRDKIPLVDEELLSAWDKLARQVPFTGLTPVEQAKVGAVNSFTEQFLAADKYVFVTPLWNLGLPPMFKAYIDTIVVAGKTFNYTENGPVGLVKGKKAVHIHARGGFYTRPPMTEMDFGDRYLRAILSFLGVTDIVSVICEGHEYMPQNAQAMLDAAVEKAGLAAREF